MVLLNGLAGRLPEVTPDQLLHRNRMGAYSAPPIILSTHKNEDRSAMARCVCCMRLALVIVATALCEHGVKKTFSRSNPGGSVPFSGRSLPSRCSTLQPFSDHFRHTLILRYYVENFHDATS